MFRIAINDANAKWHAEDDEAYRNAVAEYALGSLRSMDGTLCFLAVAFRMLAKAPWTSTMISIHIRQAALQAIHEGWFLKTQRTHGIAFGRTELALAASTFLGDLTPELPNDTDYPLFLIIHELPRSCTSLFSSGKFFCKQCGGIEPSPVPSFATSTTWIMLSWRNLVTCLKVDSAPFPWRIHKEDRNWHEKGCDRDDVDTLTETLALGFTCPCVHSLRANIPLSQRQEIFFKTPPLKKRICILPGLCVQICLKKLPDIIGSLKSAMVKLKVSMNVSRKLSLNC